MGGLDDDGDESADDGNGGSPDVDGPDDSDDGGDVDGGSPAPDKGELEDGGPSLACALRARKTEFTCRRLAVRSGEVILYTDRRIIIHKEERTEHSRRASLSWVTYRNGGIRCCRAWRRA